MEINRFYLTDKGINLMALAQTGEPLKFTRVGCGDGDVFSVEQIRGMTGLMAQKATFPVTGVVSNYDGNATLTTIISNAAITDGFSMKEVGIFADDPYQGEILYAVAVNNEYPDRIPPSTQEQFEMLIEAITTVGNSQYLTINIDRSLVFVTRDEFNDLAGTGRTRETVKQNADDILLLKIKLLALQTEKVTQIGTNQFRVMFDTLSESEDFEGFYDQANRRLVF